MAVKNVEKGAEFEDAVREFFDKVFREMGYTILEVRKQNSGTQNGFDIQVRFLDDDDRERSIFFECKNYESQLDWKHIHRKVFELGSTNYHVDCFIAISPKVTVNNIDHALKENLQNMFHYPVEHWDPNSGVDKLFAIDEDVYKKIFGVCPEKINRIEQLDFLKKSIKNLLRKKDAFKYISHIQIPDRQIVVSEDEHKTSMDKKLDEILSVDDPIRIEYHLYRCRYRIYLDSIEDINNLLRKRILDWQDNLRHKANRLTRKFSNTPNYTPLQFFNDFYDEAEKEIDIFFSDEKLKGDKEKLLSGVVFELAAECPLNWSKSI